MVPEVLTPIEISLTSREREDFWVFGALRSRRENPTVFARLQQISLVPATLILLSILVLKIDPHVFRDTGMVEALVDTHAVILVACIVVFGTAWVSLPFYVRLCARRRIRHPGFQKAHGPARICLTSEGIVHSGAVGSGIIRWDALLELCVCESVAYAFFSPMQALIIPCRAFSDKTGFDDFVAKCREYRAKAGVVDDMSKPGRFRRREIIAHCLGIVVAVFLGTFAWAYGMTTRSHFVAQFDHNMQNAPIQAAIVADDPEFRARVLQATADAYANGGWKAANDMLSAMMREKESQITWAVIHADDDLVLALWRSYSDAEHQLADKPAACRLYATGNGSSLPITDQTRKSYTLKIAAFRSGRANLASGRAPALPSQEVADELLEKSTDIGTPYSKAEWAALDPKHTSKQAASDAVVCSAYTKYDDNMLRLPEPEAAQLIRYRWGGWIAAEMTAKKHPQ